MDPLISEYRAIEPVYQDLGLRVSSLVTDLLGDKGIGCHSVTWRAKTAESLAGKLKLKSGKYNQLVDVTDLLGIRIIVYFAEDVDRIASLIEKEFLIDTINSIDQRQLLDPDRFGYISVHYVASLRPNRARLAEWRSFGDLKFEIQIRSILQHAWDEIEHDLGYKTRASVPAVVRRRLARVAALLEVADEELGEVRSEVEKYRRAASKAFTAKSELGVDRETLEVFFRQSELVGDVDRELARATRGTISQRRSGNTQDLSPRLHFLGFQTITEIEDVLRLRRRCVVEFARHWLNRSRLGNVNPGISIFYLIYVEAAQQLSSEGLASQLRSWFGAQVDSEFVDNVRSAFQSAIDSGCSKAVE